MAKVRQRYKTGIFILLLAKKFRFPNNIKAQIENKSYTNSNNNTLLKRLNGSWPVRH